MTICKEFKNLNSEITHLLIIYIFAIYFSLSFCVLRRMTIDIYGYIGQHYIYAYFNSKTSELKKKGKKNLEKISEKSPIF